MSCADTRRVALAAMLTVATALATGGAVCANVVADDIVRQADRGRGLASPYRFTARIDKEAEDASHATAAPNAAETTVVEVRSDGFARQLIFVLGPTRGDVLLRAEDVIWLRPRRLHRLTRIPADLRMFNGAATSDIAGIDLVRDYRATLRSNDCVGEGQFVVDLVARRDGVKYPQATYWIRCEGSLPRRLDLSAASGKALKTVTYGDFMTVFGQRIATRLAVTDHVFHDVAVVRMSEFAPLSERDRESFSPEYVLSLADLEAD